MRHQLRIGGTGRAGTMFPVKYLAACQHVVALESSMSWRITAPVRTVSGWFRR